MDGHLVFGSVREPENNISRDRAYSPCFDMSQNREGEAEKGKKGKFKTLRGNRVRETGSSGSSG